MRFSFLIGLLLGSLSYKSTCETDQAFSDAFSKHLSIVRNGQVKQEFNIGEMVSSITFLSVVSNRESCVRDFHHPTYKNENEFKGELNYWENWYLSNKCSFTLVKADSLIFRYNQGNLKLNARSCSE
jgi:hypothetical protein